MMTISLFTYMMTDVWLACGLQTVLVLIVMTGIKKWWKWAYARQVEYKSISLKSRYYDAENNNSILLLPLPDPTRPRKDGSTQRSWGSWQAADDHECWKILVLVGSGCFVVLYNSIVLKKH